MSLLIASAAQAITLTFDDIASAPCCTTALPVPNGYGGLNWTNAYIFDANNLGPLYDLSGYRNGVVSGQFAAYSGGRGDEYGRVTITSAVPFFFTNVDITAAWSDGLQIGVVMSLAGDLLVDFPVTVNTNGPTPVGFGGSFCCFDRIDLISFGIVQNPAPSGFDLRFVMDDFTYTPVPEPGTVLLLAAGLLGIAGWRRARD